MASWDIVVFSKDNSCEYLPSSWAADSEKKLYLWPKKLSPNQIDKLRNNCAEPTLNVEYDEWAATCKATVYDIGEARKLAEKATYTSNLSSDDDEQEDISSREQTDNEEAMEAGSVHSLKRCIGNESKSSHKDNPKRLKILSAKENRIPTRETSHTASAPWHSDKQNDNGEILKELRKMTKCLAGMNHEITEIKKDMNEINIKLNTLNEKSSKSVFPNFSKFNLPLTNQLEIDELEKNIKDTASEDFRDLVNILAHVGGVTAKKNVHIMMKKLMNRELSLEYSAQGKKQKKNFSKLSLYKAVLEAVKVNFQSATDLEITQNIGISLATAGDREGGRINRGLASTSAVK